MNAAPRTFWRKKLHDLFELADDVIPAEPGTSWIKTDNFAEWHRDAVEHVVISCIELFSRNRACLSCRYTEADGWVFAWHAIAMPVVHRDDEGYLTETCRATFRHLFG